MLVYEHNGIPCTDPGGFINFFPSQFAKVMDEAYTPIVPQILMSGMFETLVLVGISLFVVTVISRAYIWVVAKSHGQSMNEYMQGLVDSIKKQSDEK